MTLLQHHTSVKIIMVGYGIWNTLIKMEGEIDIKHVSIGLPNETISLKDDDRKNFE
jgi:hypothetical protein